MTITTILQHAPCCKSLAVSCQFPITMQTPQAPGLAFGLVFLDEEEGSEEGQAANPRKELLSH